MSWPPVLQHDLKKVLSLDNVYILLTDIIMATCLCHKITVMEDVTATCPAPHGTLWTSVTR